jgi:hypothetical protein
MCRGWRLDPASELLGEILPPKLRGTPRTVRHLVDVDRLQWPAPVEVPKVVLMPKLPPVPQGKRKAAAKPVRLSHADWLAVQRANAANLHAQLRARREAQAPAREARKARIAEVGAFIKRRRIALDLSQHDVAMLVGYPTRAQVGAFETWARGAAAEARCIDGGCAAMRAGAAAGAAAE